MKAELKWAARVTILRAPDMTARGKREIAGWLKRQAGFLLNHNKQLSSRYTATWWYRGKSR